MSATRFLDSLENAQHTAGVYLLPGFVSSVEAGELFESLNDDSIFPWDLKPVLYGERLTQHAYLFKRKQKDIEKWPGTTPPLPCSRSAVTAVADITRSNACALICLQCNNIVNHPIRRHKSVERPYPRMASELHDTPPAQQIRSDFAGL